MTKIISWNINGIRAVVNKGFMTWLKKSKADVVCLQEIKATPEQLPPDLIAYKKYHQIALPAERKGYSGVMTLTKVKPNKTIYGLGKKEFDCEGRTLIHIFDNFILLNCYFPNGQRDHNRVPYKLKFSDEVQKKMKALHKKYKLPVICAGDYNTAHNEIDLANPKTNQKTTGFLPIEREWMDKFTKSGFVDCFRRLHPTKKDVYSWWTYRNDCRGRNIGWRIDYFFINEDDFEIVKSCKYLTNVMGSDHCPVELTIQ